MFPNCLLKGNTMNIHNELSNKLAQTAYMACFGGLPEKALTIFEGIAAVRPNNVNALMGLAATHINALQLDNAKAILRERRPS